MERLVDRVDIPANQIFPSEELLDHVPLLVDGIAAYIEDPGDEVHADAPVTAKAMELGALRHAQGFDVYQILKEYEILGGVLFTFLIQTVDEIELPCTRGELLTCAHRLHRAISIIQQHTTMHFLHQSDARTREREDRLRSFNRAVSHELKNRIHVIGGAAGMLQEQAILETPEQVARFTSIITRNAAGMQETIQSLLELSRMETAAQRGRNVTLPDAAFEAARELREFAHTRGVRIELDPELPNVEVPAAAVELALTNYISNAIKYRDPDNRDRWVRVEAELHDFDNARGTVVKVRDNGVGVPPSARPQLFRRFFRAHETVIGEEGSGLGLSIVRETIESVGGRAWAEFPEQGAVFAFSVPCLGESA